MVAAEAAKDHSLQGCRAQQHKETLTLHQLLIVQDKVLSIRYKVLKKVVGEDVLQMTLIA